MSKTIAITGANGFIGTALVALLHTNGYHIKALVHHIPLIQLDGVDYYKYDLAAAAPQEELFKDVDVLIHLAFDFKKPKNQDTDINLSAARLLKSLCLDKYIFISSFSALADARSYYGRCKYEMEKIFDSDAIIRPGLVLGNGGLFARIKQQIKKSTFVPLIAGGKQPMQTIYLTDLLFAVKRFIESDRKGIYNLADNTPVSYKMLMQLIADNFKKKIYLIPVPILIIRFIIFLTQWMKQPVVSQDNLEGLLQSRYIDTAADLRSLELSLLNTKETLQKLI
jgi:nucleoside-diphosphate-sugar epimerase